MQSRKRKLLVWTVTAAMLTLLCTVTVFASEGEAAEYVPSMYATFWALVPPIVAIALALITKEVYSSLFVGILLYSLYKAKSFLATGMWLAILAILTMDYALMSLQMAMLFLVVYLVCFYRKRVKNGE